MSSTPLLTEDLLPGLLVGSAGGWGTQGPLNLGEGLLQVRVRALVPGN